MTVKSAGDSVKTPETVRRRSILAQQRILGNNLPAEDILSKSLMVMIENDDDDDDLLT